MNITTTDAMRKFIKKV